MADYYQVSTATESKEAATELARSVIEARLGAGAQVIGPVASTFWHEGKFGEGQEWQLLIKTTADRYDALERHLLAHHPWANPEIVAVPILQGSAGYLRWLDASTRAQD